jgi:AcrR family transcriptional regulator
MVASQSGLSVQTFYKHYPKVTGGKHTYLMDVLMSLPVGQATVHPGGVTTSAQGDGTRAAVRSWAKELYSSMTDRTDMRSRRAARVLAPESEQLSKRVASAYAALDDRVGSSLKPLMRDVGTPRLRQPFTYESVAKVLIALSEGLDLRAHYDPGFSSTGAFVEAVVGLLAAVADTDDRHTHIDDAALAGQPELSVIHTIPMLEELPDDPEQALVDAAAVEFAQRGYFATSQEHIARRAGVSGAVLRALFPSNVDIVVAALVPTVAVLRRRIENDLRLERSPKDIISSFPARMAEQIIAKRSFVDAMALVLSLHGAQAQVDATHIRDELFFPGIIVGCIAEGQQQGQVTSALKATDLAVTLTNNVIFRCLSRRDETAAEVGAAINRMFLPVLFAVGERDPATPDTDGQSA